MRCQNPALEQIAADMQPEIPWCYECADKMDQKSGPMAHVKWLGCCQRYKLRCFDVLRLRVRLR